MAAQRPICLTTLGTLKRVQTGDTLDLIGYQLPTSVGAAGYVPYVQAGSSVLGWASVPKWQPDASYYLDASGSDANDGSYEQPWFTFAKVFAALTEKIIVPGQQVNVAAQPGWYTYSSPQTISSPYNGALVRIYGSAIHRDATVSAVSGSSGSWTITLEVSTTEGLEVGDWFLVPYVGNVVDWHSNTICGLHYVTQIVDSTHVRVHNTSGQATGVSVGTGTTAAKFLKTTFDFSECPDRNKLTITAGTTLWLDDCVLLGTVPGETNFGYAWVNGKLYSSGGLCFAGWEVGANVVAGGVLDIQQGGAARCDVAIQASQARLTAFHCAFTGNGRSVVASMSDVQTNESIYVGCPTYGLSLSSCRAQCGGALFQGNAFQALRADNQSTCDASSAYFAYNGVGAAASLLSSIRVTNLPQFWEGNTTASDPVIGGTGNQNSWVVG
jgi:hypothetical protein